MYTEIYSVISILSKKTEKSGQEKLAIRTLFKQWRCSNPCCLFEPFCLREYVKLGFCYLGCLHLGFSPKSKWDNKNKTWYKPSSPFLNFLQRDNMQHFPRLYWNLLPFATNFMKKNPVLNFLWKYNMVQTKQSISQFSQKRHYGSK